MLPATLLRLCILRANPQDLPASPALLAALLLAHAAGDALGLVDTLPLEDALQAAAVDTAVLVVITAAALKLRGLSSRLTQTLSALAGAGAVLSLVSYALLRLVSVWLSPAIAGVVLILWFLVVYTHVLREALSLRLGQATAVSLLYLFASTVLSLLYLGTASPPP